jgi:hypothetical protein
MWVGIGNLFQSFRKDKPPFELELNLDCKCTCVIIKLFVSIIRFVFTGIYYETFVMLGI